MKRRKFLKLATALVTVPFAPEISKESGWVPPEHDFNIRRFPEQLRVDRKAILLYKFLENATQRIFVPHKQETVDCTSHATGLAIDITQAIQVCLGNDRWIKEIATELLHIGGREIVGGRTSGGVSISGSVKFATDYGNIYRIIYPGWDFTEYSLSNIKRIDEKTTKELELLLNEARYHPILDSFRVSNAEQACAAMSNLRPVVLGSMTAFNKKRDKEGFIQPVRGRWAHAWTVIGYDTKFHRPGVLLMSSWGKNWVSGPKRNQPDGSAWIDMKVFDRMMDEAIAIESFQGVTRG